MSDEFVQVVEEYRGEKGALISILQGVQEKFGYLSAEAISKIARLCRLSESEVFGVASFYTQFYFTPRGRHKIKVCLGTACHVRGAVRVLERLEQSLGIKSGETTPDYNFTLETVNCIGACALGPVVTIDEDYFGQMNPEKVDQVLNLAKS